MHLRGHQNYYHPSWEGLVCNFTRMSFKQLRPLHAASLTVCFHFTLNTSWKGKLLGHTLHPEAVATCCKVLLPVTLPLPTHAVTPKHEGLLCPLADSSSERRTLICLLLYTTNPRCLHWFLLQQLAPPSKHSAGLYGSLLPSRVLGPLLHNRSPKANHMGPKTVPFLHTLVSWVTPLPRDVHVLQTKPIPVFLELENESKSR